MAIAEQSQTQLLWPVLTLNKSSDGRPPMGNQIRLRCSFSTGWHELRSTKNLSPADFEELARDLVGRDQGVRFEAFAAGPDQGMDGRHAIGKSKEGPTGKTFRRIKIQFSEVHYQEGAGFNRQAGSRSLHPRNVAAPDAAKQESVGRNNRACAYKRERYIRHPGFRWPAPEQRRPCEEAHKALVVGKRNLSNELCERPPMQSTQFRGKRFRAKVEVVMQRTRASKRRVTS